MQFETRDLLAKQIGGFLGPGADCDGTLQPQPCAVDVCSDGGTDKVAACACDVTNEVCTQGGTDPIPCQDLTDEVPPGRPKRKLNGVALAEALRGALQLEA